MNMLRGRGAIESTEKSVSYRKMRHPPAPVSLIGLGHRREYRLELDQTDACVIFCAIRPPALFTMLKDK